MRILILLIALVFPISAYAVSQTGIETNIAARLNVQAKIPALLYLQIGSQGSTVDSITFNFSEFTLSDLWISSIQSPRIVVAGIIPSSSTITLTADSSAPLIGQSTGRRIFFQRIRMSGSGDFSSIRNLRFNRSTNQTIWQKTGSGYNEGDLNFEFLTSLTLQPDTYKGQVTYTLSAP